MTIERWQALLNQLNVIDQEILVNSTGVNLLKFTEQTGGAVPIGGFRDCEPPQVITKNDLLVFEAQMSIILPIEYKEFLLVFGSGSFGRGFLDIYSPNWERSQSDLEILKDAGDEGFLKDALGWEAGSEYITPEEAKQTRSKMNFAFVFGGSPRQESLFWDLRTYSEIDQSYDIYIARLDQIPVRICRSFFEFVHDICFGLNPHTVFPLQLQPYLDEISLIFRRSN